MKLKSAIDAIVDKIQRSGKCSIAYDKRDLAKFCSLHCILNGPIGVNKNTTFVTLDGSTWDGPIQQLIMRRCSNRSWRSLCFLIAKEVKRLHPEVLANAQTVKIHGDV
ncbi:unnamed protein product [Wuchereria bancrofti]|uniref:Uncharacterized protein n=1 Tax=Wuchereria bancrofti TaxID=6293 RepID=A0A3P7E537_WUCBA|nr:unnamed protein product [Wuchereria bancrofti]